MEINAVENELCRVQTAQMLFDRLVDLTVVGNGRLPTHAADEAYGLHEDSCVLEVLYV